MGPMVVLHHTQNGSYHLAKLDGTVSNLYYMAFCLIPYHTCLCSSIPVTHLVDYDDLACVIANKDVIRANSNFKKVWPRMVKIFDPPAGVRTLCVLYVHQHGHMPHHSGSDAVRQSRKNCDIGCVSSDILFCSPHLWLSIYIYIADPTVLGSLWNLTLILFGILLSMSSLYIPCITSKLSCHVISHFCYHSYMLPPISLSYL